MPTTVLDDVEAADALRAGAAVELLDRLEHADGLPSIATGTPRSKPMIELVGCSS